MSQNSLVLPTTGTVSGLQMTQNMNNALDTINTLASGASAPGSPEAGQLWHDTTNNLLKIRDLANTTWIIIGMIDETNKLFNPANLPFAVPQGRLTLTSNTPVMTADATAAAAIYYTPYIGNIAPIYNGTNFINNAFSQLTLTLNTTNHLGGRIYDIFVFINSGALTMGAGPAWSNGTTRSAAISQLDGIWVNSASINLTNGSTTYSAVAASEATYLGTFYATANGQTGMSLRPAATSGGTNNIIGLWNAYNRVVIAAACSDNSAAWTYTTNTVRPANNSASNRISWIDGLGQSAIVSRYACGINTASASNGGQVGIGLNSTTAFASNSAVALASLAANSTAYVTGELDAYPVPGFNYVQALETCPFYTSGNMDFNNGTVMQLSLNIQA